MIDNEEYLGFGLLAGQKKQFEDIILICILSKFYRLNY